MWLIKNRIKKFYNHSCKPTFLMLKVLTCQQVNAIKIYITTHLSDEQQYNGWPEMAFPGYKALKDNENF